VISQTYSLPEGRLVYAAKVRRSVKWSKRIKAMFQQ
jgi:hypothetical protein